MFCIVVSRWEVIANYMNIHSSSGVKRTAKDVIGKAKSLQKLGELHFCKIISLLPQMHSLKKSMQFNDRDDL